MKKAFILHGMSGSVDSSFGVKLKEDLTRLGYKIFQPSFTTGKDITLNSWFDEMDKIKNQIEDDSIFICHSLACLFIVKYCNANKIANKLIITIAGGICEENEIADQLRFLMPFIPTNQDVNEFLKLNNKIYNIYSDTDHIYKLSQLEKYNQKLQAVPVFLPNQGHFGKTSGVKEIPDIIDIITKEKHL